MRETGYRCVTLEGDDFNPGGTLTGGSRRSGGGCSGRVGCGLALQQRLHSAVLFGRFFSHAAGPSVSETDALVLGNESGVPCRRQLGVPALPSCLLALLHAGSCLGGRSVPR